MSEVGDVHDLVAAVSLESIETYRLVATRNLGAGEDADDLEIDPLYTLTVDFRDAGDGFRVRLQIDIATPRGDISCGVMADYHTGEVTVKGSSNALTEFINGVALMHILPFIRQSIADLTARVFGAPLLMPMIQRGEISFSPGSPEPIDV